MAQATPLTPEQIAAHPAAAWEPRRQLTLEQARRRSTLVPIWRWLFIGLAGAAVVAVIVSVVVDSLGVRFGETNRLTESEALRVINPRFNGRDRAGAPYEVTAESAVRRSMTSDLIDLQKPVYVTRDSRTMTAPHGVYDQANQILDLAGPVVFRSDTGDRIETAVARVDIGRNLVKGVKPVKGNGRSGDVRGDSFEILDNGNVLKLHGNVRGYVRDLKSGKGRP